MIEILRFVRGAVADKDLIPVLTHFSFYGGRVQGTNGRLTIDAECPVELEDLECTVPAEQFLKAIDACGGEPKSIKHDTEKETLVVTKGKFRVKLTTRPLDEFPVVEPDSTRRVKQGDMLGPLRTLRHFIGEDASRPWACGVLLKDGYAYATNNIIVCRTPCTWKGKRAVNIPSEAVEELLRVDEEPTHTSMSENTVTFFYDDDSWLRTQLLSAQWPDMDALCSARPRKRIPEGLREAVQRLIPFCPDKNYPLINFDGDTVKTDSGNNEASEGGFGDLHPSTFHADMLQAVLDVATHLDLTKYPKACPFSGKNVAGAIVGIRKSQ